MAGRLKNNQQLIVNQLRFRQTKNAEQQNKQSAFVFLISSGTGQTEHRIPPHRQCFNVGGKRKTTTYKFSTMPDKSEKERRKQIMNDLKERAVQEFESSLPASRENFKKLFDYLDAQLRDKVCDDNHSLTRTFLLQYNVENADKVLEWLAEHGGYCDCEILANVEEQFE